MREDDLERLEQVYSDFRQDYEALLTTYVGRMTFSEYAAILGSITGLALVSMDACDDPKQAMCNFYGSLYETIARKSGIDIDITMDVPDRDTFK